MVKRTCIITAVLSLAIALYIVQVPAPKEPYRTWLTPLRLSTAPADLLSVFVLPREYSCIHCVDGPPAHQLLVFRTVFIFMNVLFWTAASAIAASLARRSTQIVRSP